MSTNKADGRETERDEEWDKEEAEAAASAKEMSREELEQSYVCAMLNWTEALRQRDEATAKPTADHLTSARMFLAAHGKRTGWTLQHPLARILANTEHAAFNAGLERAAKVADGFMPAGVDPIGPLHGVGRAYSATHIASAIRALKLQ